MSVKMKKGQTGEVRFNFSGNVFDIKVFNDDKYDLNDLRRQVDAVKKGNTLASNDPREEVGCLVDKSPLEDPVINKFKPTTRMGDWSKYLSVRAVKRYGMVVEGRGRHAKTLANKKGILAYASWLNERFREAIEDAFLALVEGRDEDARSIAGDAMLDMDMVARVNKRWKVYVKWCYENFSDVNSMYGGNLTRMVISSATGVSTVSSVKGKVGEDYITKLANQGHGGAILSVNATLNLVGNTMRTSLFKNLLTTRGGKKEAYATLKEMLNWTDEFE